MAGVLPRQGPTRSRSERMRVSIGQKLTLSFLLVALLVGVLGIVGYSNMRETGKQVDVIREKSDGLVKLSEMKSYVLEAISEALAYPLLDDPSEKAEFYEKLDQFDASAAEFLVIAHIGHLGQEEETELFNQMVTAKESLASAAGDMFESYERDGILNLSHDSAFDKEIHALLPLIDQFLGIEKKRSCQRPAIYSGNDSKCGKADNHSSIGSRASRGRLGYRRFPFHLNPNQ